MKKKPLAEIAFYVSTAFLATSLVFMLGFYNGARDTAIKRGVAAVKRSIDLVASEADTLTGVRPVQWTEDRRYEGDGVTRNAYAEGTGEYILLQSFFDDGIEVRLIDRSGRIVNRWPLAPFELIEDLVPVENRPTSAWNFNTHGMAIRPDGSLVLNIDHHGLVKLDRCGTKLWGLAEPTHHAVTAGPDGSLWVPNTRQHRDGAPGPHGIYPGPIAEDTLLHVSSAGEPLHEISVLDSLLESGEIGLLTLGGGSTPRPFDTGRPDFSREIFHLNDVEPLPEAFAERFPSFSAGDLLVSLRNRNALLVIDPETERVKWSMIGNWSRQHDPDWMPDGTLSLFDNARDGTDTGERFGSSRILSIDPETKAQRVLYGDADHFFHSTRRGKQQVLDDGRILITEAEAGRAFEVNARGELLWEYVNGFDADYTLNLSEAIAVPRAFFDTDDWSCPG